METKNIDEKQIIDFLKQREKLLREELKKIEATISVIESSNMAILGRPSINFSSEQKKQAKIKTKKNNTKKLLPVIEFKENGKLDEKISYAINELKSASKDDILEVICDRQPNVDTEGLKNVLAVRLSYLIKNNKIKGKKEGRKYQYSLY